jgi:hypothetical protein
MSAEDKLAELCRRYGFERARAGDLLPLVERALSSPPTIGRCLLAVVEATLATKAAEAGDRSRLEEQLDQRVLVALAGVLHGWDPDAPAADR